MKKKFLALGVLSMLFVSAYADEKDLVATATSISTKSSGEISKDSVYWKFPGQLGLNVNQAYFNDYCTDGTGASVSLDAFADVNANYQKERVKWENNLNAKYGFIYSNQFVGDDLIRKNVDEFHLGSKFGYKLGKYWYASAMAILESQFTKGYSYAFNDSTGKDEPTLVSDFFAPGNLKLSLGADFVPNKYFNMFLSPLTARFTFCRLDELAPNYGMELIEAAKYDEVGNLLADAIYDHSRAELGAYAILRSDFDITKNFHFFSSLEGFYAYRKHVFEYRKEFFDWCDMAPENSANNPDEFETLNGMSKMHTAHGWYIRWKLELLLKVSKYVNVSFKTQYKFDNAEQKVVDGKNAGFPRAGHQFWETTSLGVSYKF